MVILGIVFQRKTYKGRAYLTALVVFIAIPAYSVMFIIPLNNLWLPDNSNPVSILLYLLKSIVINPWMTVMFVLAFLASAGQSGNTPNWLALITDVNLPEHRATVFSVANLIGGLGRTIGNVGVGFILSIFQNHC